jgi:hypothetical protein
LPCSSHTEIRAHNLTGQLVNFTGSHPAALIKNAELAYHMPRDWKLLFHQQHGLSLFFIQAQDNLADFMHDVRLDAFGRLT